MMMKTSVKKVISNIWGTRNSPSNCITTFNNALLSFRHFSTDVVSAPSPHESITRQMLNLDINSQIGSTMPLSAMRIGTIINNIEMRPGQGGKLVRAAGTGAKILKENLDRNKALKEMLGRRKTKKERDDERERKKREKANLDDTLKDPSTTWCLIKLPSGAEKLIDSQCRATIGMVSNASHSNRKLVKAGQKRWLARRPVVRGVAMNPIDHPHGGGEGRSKSSGRFGRVSQTPWGKPTKSGYKTGPFKRKK